MKHATNPSKNVKLIPTATILVRSTHSEDRDPMMSYPLNAKKQIEAPENI